MGGTSTCNLFIGISIATDRQSNDDVRCNNSLLIVLLLSGELKTAALKACRNHVNLEIFRPTRNTISPSFHGSSNKNEALILSAILIFYADQVAYTVTSDNLLVLLFMFMLIKFTYTCVDGPNSLLLICRKSSLQDI